MLGGRVEEDIWILIQILLITSEDTVSRIEDDEFMHTDDF